MDKTIAPLASIPSEHTRYEYKTYLSIPRWNVIFLRNDYYRFIKVLPNHLFPYFKAIGNYWKSYWIMDRTTKGKTSLKFMSHMKLLSLGIAITTEWSLKCFYEKTVGLLTYYLCPGLTPQDEVMIMVSQEYADFIKYNDWYEFDFFSRWIGFIKQLKNIQPLQIIRQLERTIYFSVELLSKGVLTQIVKFFYSINYHQPNTRTALELEYLPEQWDLDAQIDIIGEYQKHVVLSVPRHFEFKEYIKKLSTDNQIYSIAGNTQDTLIMCRLPKYTDYTAIKLEPILLEKMVYDELVRVIYRIPISELIKFKRFCEIKNITIEHIFDF